MTAILISGATGSFGKAFLAKILRDHIYDRIVLFSRDELKQSDLRQTYPENIYPQLRFFIGDIRDRYRLERALEGIDHVVHAAALKHVPIAEYNPTEFINTNINGTENLIQASISAGVSRFVALSTDKAASPANLYGATKLCADKIVSSANNICGSRDLRLSNVRYGNVMGSRGSVIPFFIQQAKKGVIPITDTRMTRFNIILDHGVDLVLWALNNMCGGETFVPKLPSYNILDVAKAIAPSITPSILGIRPGEKIHEEMITIHDAAYTIDLHDKYAILSATSNPERYSTIYANASYVPSDFSYSSGSNTDFLSIDHIRSLILTHLDPTFSPI